MVKLIKLELIKDNFRKYMMAAVISAICIIALSALIGIVQEDGESAFNNAADVLAMGDVLIRAVYIVFAGVLIGNIIVAEFKSGTIQNVFVYPIPRKKIMVCKLVLVFVFTFSAYTITGIIYAISMAIINALIPMVPETISVVTILGRIPAILSAALLTSGLSLISLYFGLKKKSVPTTIVTSMILASVLSNTFGETPADNLFGLTIVPITLCVLGIAIAAAAFKNINRIDVN